MAIEILLPRLGWTMEEGTLIEWLKRDGDRVQPGDVLYTVESDKSLNEVEAFDAGILRIPPDSPAPGSKVPVGALLAYIVQPGEDVPTAGAPAASAANPAAAVAPAAEQPRATAGRAAEPTISPRARRVAAGLGVDWKALTGSGRTGRIVERDVRAAASKAAAVAINASPLAQRLAADLGVDLGQLAQAVPGQRIERADVERAVAAARAAAAQAAERTPTPPGAPVPAQAEFTRAPMTRTRRVIADRMSAAARTAAPVTLTAEADASELVKLRAQLKADAEARSAGADALIPSINDVLIKIAATALLEHPALNARLDGDDIVTYHAAHVGLAVDVERGLLVVVVRDAQDKTLRQIAAESRRLIERARAGTSSPDELRGSTFTITNLGAYGIDAFTPILNMPECAILGVGRIAPKQVVVDAAAEKVAIRHMATLSLTFDHRLVDGAPAARFLQRVKQLIEQPYLWLV
jgi:pyruvate dehydrogenase E2 component (dihydrolipoamide acetyltransferase)